MVHFIFKIISLWVLCWTVTTITLPLFWKINLSEMNGGKGDLPSHNGIHNASCKTLPHSYGYHIAFFREKSKR